MVAVGMTLVSLFLMPVTCDLSATAHSIFVTPITASSSPISSASSSVAEWASKAEEMTSQHHGNHRHHDMHDSIPASGEVVYSSSSSEALMTNVRVMFDHEMGLDGGLTITLPVALPISYESVLDSTLSLGSASELMAYQEPPLVPPPRS